MRVFAATLALLALSVPPSLAQTYTIGCLLPLTGSSPATNAVFAQMQMGSFIVEV